LTIDAPAAGPGGPWPVAALDLGGTKIAGALVEADGTLLGPVRRPTPRLGTADQVAAAVTEVLDLLAADPRWPSAAAVGIGSAGPVDRERGTVSPVNIPAWRDFPLAEHVREATGRPVALAGDAVAFAAAEHWLGAAAGFDNALCIVVSTGVGGGLVLDGRLYVGRTGNAGHIGHISVDQFGPRCPCGGRGCVELYTSGTSIARWYREQGGAERDAAAIGVAAGRGEELAVAAYDRAARALAAAIAATASLAEVEVAVIGGGVAQSGEVLLEPLRRHLADYAALPFAANVRVLPAMLGTDAGLVGAAALAAGPAAASKPGSKSASTAQRATLADALPIE
jgi:glucokinase